MKQRNPLQPVAAFAFLLFFAAGCSNAATDTAAGTKTDTSQAAPAKQDPAQLKATIQELETAFAAAYNAGDAKTITAFYADDAITLNNNAPASAGHDAIEKEITGWVTTKVKGSTVSFDVQDAFGCENYITEIGKTTKKDSTGKVFYTGKYMAIWEKRNDKWSCIRDISNDDVKAK